ncbi:MAG: hypothetical protein Q9212_000708 [Teloschistes hypoglaucus]
MQKCWISQASNCLRAATRASSDWASNNVRQTLSDVSITRTGKPIIRVQGGRSALGASRGCTVVVPYREEMARRHLKVTGDLGRVVFMEWDMRNTPSIEESVRHSDIVYNLVGRDYPTKNFDFEDVHVESAERIAEAVAKYDVDRFVHVSSYNADKNSPSAFFRTKGQAEEVVRNIFPETTLVRPAPAFGFEDKLLHKLAGVTNMFTSNHMRERFWPVHAIDIGSALAVMAEDDTTASETYELHGPKNYSMAEIAEIVDKEIIKHRRHINIPPRILKTLADMYNRLIWWSETSSDSVTREFIDQKIDPNAKTFKDLGIEPGALANLTFQYLIHDEFAPATHDNSPVRLFTIYATFRKLVVELRLFLDRNTNHTTIESLQNCLKGLKVSLITVLFEGLDRGGFAAGMQRLIPFLGYHHILMFLIVAGIILLSLLLAGCSSTSPGIPNIFLISLYYEHYPPSFDPAQVDPGVTTAIANIVGQAQLEVRVGYFGICINPDGGSFLCSNNASSLASQVSVDQDPLNLIWVASTFKDSIVFPYLIIVAMILAFICFILLATFPGWHEETDERGSERDVKPFPSRPVSQVALALIFVASVFVLVSVLWQHTASVAASTIAQDLGNGSVKSGVGTTAMILGWFGFALFIIVTIGLLVMILSISLLDRLTDD